MESECGERERGGVVERAMTCMKRERVRERGRKGEEEVSTCLNCTDRTGRGLSVASRLPAEILELKNYSASLISQSDKTTLQEKSTTSPRVHCWNKHPIRKLQTDGCHVSIVIN